MSSSAPFICSICEQESVHICVKCKKDTCNNHLCEKCGSCSDCCDCEVHLDSGGHEAGEPDYEAGHAA